VRVCGVSGVTTVDLFLAREEYIVSFNKDIIWRKRRWAIHLGSEGLICLAGRELQIHRLMTLINCG
jgi:hypothetical protein